MDFQFWITNETSGIAQAISKSFGKDNVANFHSEFDFFKTFVSPITNKKEIDVLDPTLKKLIETSEIDMILHSNVLSPEQTEENKQSALTRNIGGALNIANISKELRVPVIHIEYPTCYSDEVYNMTSFCNDSIRKMYSFMNVPHVIIRPPIIYGVDDSPISKILSKSSEEESINIDPEKKKPLMHISDFVKHLRRVVENHKNLSIVDIPPSEILTFEEIIENIYEYRSVVNFIFNDSMDLDPEPNNMSKWDVENDYTIDTWLRGKDE